MAQSTISRRQTTDGTQPPASFDPAIQDFFDRLAKGMTAADGRTIATMWEVPAFVLGDAQGLVVTSLDEIAQFYSGAREQYTSVGIVDTRAEILYVEWMTERLVLVKARWPLLDRQGNTHGEEGSMHVLRRDNAGNLKIRVAVVHDVKTTHQ